MYIVFLIYSNVVLFSFSQEGLEAEQGNYLKSWVHIIKAPKIIKLI